jgi:L-ribulose-5-phosphate 3-epimerase
MKGCRLGLYEKSMPNSISWEEKLSSAKQAGFDFIEMSVDETDEKLKRLDMNASKKLSLISAMSRKGLYLESMCLSGHRRFPIGSEDSLVRSTGMDIMRKAVVFARDLGIRIIQIAGYDEYYNPSTEATRRLFAENLEESVSFAAQYGVSLAFETMETEFMNTVSKAMSYVNKVNSPYLNVYPDSGNITNAALLYKTDAILDLKSGSGHLSALHLKESLPGKYREVPFGTGHVDFHSIIETAYELGVRRFVAEFWCSGDDWKSDLLKARRFFSVFN